MTDRAVAVALALLAGAVTLNGHPAHAANAPAGTSGPPSAVATCVLRGVTEPRINANIEDSQGRVVARFSGAPTALVATDFPVDARGRVHIQTGTGAGGFRVRGYLQVQDLPLYTASNVPVIARHLWIAAGRGVTFLGAAPGRMRIEKRVSSPLAQTFSAWAPCSAIVLAAPLPSTWSPPADARGWLLKAQTLELYDQPAGSVLTTLTRANDVDAVAFYGSERRGDWLGITHHGDVIVDAGARARDLSALPAGEIMDQLAPRTSTRSPAHLAIQGEPRVVKPVREVPLRAVAKENDPPIGVIEPGAETYVLDIVAGWASVMPKALNVVPGPDGQFWVKATDLSI
jgi:hypothetical protein